MSDTTEDLLADIPPVEPESTEQPKKRRGRPPKAESSPAPSNGKKKGSHLLADLDQYKHGLSQTYAFWVGVTSSCPKPGIDLAGINFPAVTGHKSSFAEGERELRPGAIVRLRKDQVERMIKRLPQTVIRFRDYPAEHAPELSSRFVSNVEGSQVEKPRGGTLITIPTKEEIEQVRARGTYYPEYQAQPTDEPAARYMYCMLCEDQQNPQRGTFYRTLEETGLEWPGDKE